jgi:type IV pilus assembly protein PilW
MNSFKRIKQLGFSLVELMVALALSSVLLLGLFQIFTSNKQAFSLQDGVARLQESGRISMEFLSRNLRVAGYMGCATGASNFTNNVQDNSTKLDNAQYKQALIAFDGDSGLTGFDNITDTTGTVLADIGLSVGTDPGQIISGTDAVVIQGVRACPGGKVISGNSGNANIKIESAAACALEKNDVVIVSNCEGADMFGIVNNPNDSLTPPASGDTLTHGVGGINNSPKLNGVYDNESYIFKPRFTVFYIGNGANDASGAIGEPALYMNDLNYAGDETAFGSSEIAQGIEDMQLLYGEDTDQDGTVNRYVDASDVSDFFDVVAVRSRLLARSQNGATSTAQTYSFNGATVTAGDLRMRVPYETTNAIRNRIN